MTSDLNSDRIDELIALAALGELSAEDERELDAVVRTDPAVAAEVDEALAAAAALQRTHAEEPPPALRSSVLAAIASTPQEQAVPATGTPGGERETTDDTSRVVSLESQRARRGFRPVMLAAAAVALFAVGGVVLVVSDDDGPDPIAAVVEAPDATRRTLSGEIEQLTVIYSASQDALVVEGDGVPAVDDTATYQLWLVGDGGATSVGIFRPDTDGRVSERFANVDPTDFVLGVTREPAGGSESPTLPILASA
ncbi:MAG TPA: anti-sigma factor [Ilumatobacteraceae bacterium]|nr:anti-sigma factor [Ilumatobacteraceae bacterium]